MRYHVHELTHPGADLGKIGEIEATPETLDRVLGERFGVRRVKVKEVPDDRSRDSRRGP
jgi:hypothetical protein